MSNTLLPNLGDWHELPYNAILPAGTDYIQVKPDGRWNLLRGASTNLTYNQLLNSLPLGSRIFTQDKVDVDLPDLMDEECKYTRVDADGDAVIWTRRGWSYLSRDGEENSIEEFSDYEGDFADTLEAYESQFSNILRFL